MRSSAQAFEAATRLQGFADRAVTNWDDIHAELDRLTPAPGARPEPRPFDLDDSGVGFVTFEYGIDGVSIEIAKYAVCLEALLTRQQRMPDIHCVGGGFSTSAHRVLLRRWHRHEIAGANGWSKWHGGKYFDRLFQQDMPADSIASKEMATEIWNQAVAFAKEIVRICQSDNIGVLISVNVNSNPGNPALALGIVLASEVADIPVLNSSHDFYWESGLPVADRKPDQDPGARDHFFRNHENQSFFALIQRIFPWNGASWQQLVINETQREKLIAKHQIDPADVDQLGTFIENSFFAPCTAQRRRDLRSRLGLILSRGEFALRARSLQDFVAEVGAWMVDQKPVVCGSESGLEYDLRDPSALWFLQPTRVVPRKRIERDWELIGALLGYEPFRIMFDQDPDLTLTLHVTGPVPLEHEADLLRVLDAYRQVLKDVPGPIRRRLFLAFSAGHVGHSALEPGGPNSLMVADFYHLADLVLLPSTTEGRGLPILEAAAAGRPLVCSRYEPIEVFLELVGESLEPERQIQYSVFPEGNFRPALLQEITDMVFLPESIARRSLHNRRAMASRYGMHEVTRTFAGALKRLGCSSSLVA